MKSEKQEYPLNAENVDRLSDLIFDRLTERKVKRQEALRIRISVENVLLFWMDALGDGESVTLAFFRRFGKENVQVRCRGREANPFSAEEEEEGRWVRSLKASLEAEPVFEYMRGVNSVTFLAKSDEKNRLLVTFGSVVLGAILGFAGLLLPDGVRETIRSGLILPLYEAYLSMLAFCCIPLIFISLVTGIVGVGNLDSFTRNGSRMLKRYLLIVAAVVLVTLFIALPFFRLNYGSEAYHLRLEDFVTLILGWLPEGPFHPFISMDAMQLIIMGAAFGICILALNLTGGPFVGTINNLHQILLKISGWITSMIPGFVCITLVNSIWNSTVAVLLSAWKSWVITTGVQLLIILCLCLSVVFRFKVPLRLVIKKISRLFLIGLGTNSCNATVPEDYNCCGNRMGMDPRVFSFGIPIGTTIYKPATAARLILLCLFMAEAEQIPVSLGWLILLCIMAFVLSIAIPAIPGGTIMFCAMFFAQMGLPDGLVTQMLTTDIFFDCTCTAFNQIAVPLTLVSHAGRMELLNEEVLRSEA